MIFDLGCVRIADMLVDCNCVIGEFLVSSLKFGIPAPQRQRASVSLRQAWSFIASIRPAKAAQ